MPAFYGKSKSKTEKFTAEKISIADVILSSPVHTILAKLLKKVKLLKALKSSDKITVFAPTNDAFRNLKVSLGSLSKNEIKNILLSHVLQYSKSPPPNFKKMKTFKTLAPDGRKLDASRVLPSMKVSNALKLSNGTLYVINKVLI
jgi:uncharacterized surface protein with fasciclin (FAS1) repeats